MEITREIVQQHLDGLKVGLAQIEAEFQAQLGSIREAEFWLEYLAKEPEAPKVK